MAKFAELVIRALQFQAEGLLTIGEILLSSEAETRRWFHNIPTEERHWFRKNWADLYRNRQQFYRTLHYLQRAGLAERKGKARKSPWILTERGRKRDQWYRELQNDPFSAVSGIYPKPHGSSMTVVAYDIPERERRKRDWMRLCLLEMDFKKIQQSVWVARGTVNTDFIHALRERGLLRYVHIFAVTKEGTLHDQIV